MGRSTIRSFIFLPQVVLTSGPLIVFVFWGFSPPAGDAADDDDEEEGDEGEPDDEAEDKVGAEEVLTPITLTQDDLCERRNKTHEHFMIYIMNLGIWLLVMAQSARGRCS